MLGLSVGQMSPLLVFLEVDAAADNNKNSEAEPLNRCQQTLTRCQPLYWLGRALGFMSSEHCLHVRHKENTSHALVLMER
jgi:hypothetical protein